MGLFFVSSSALLLTRNKNCGSSDTGSVPERLLTSQVLSPSLRSSFLCALPLPFVTWCTLNWGHLAPHCFACSVPKPPHCLPPALLTAVSWQHTCLWLSWVSGVVACLQVKTWKSTTRCDLRNQQATASPWCSPLLTSKITLALVFACLTCLSFPSCYITKALILSAKPAFSFGTKQNNVFLKGNLLGRFTLCDSVHSCRQLWTYAN